ncbi:xanthine dehydrogenase family protein molybdopterin-binding subunit [Amycolatopsis sp. cmx-11-12]|uniref:xanthine dehydrogenase family protein molybdopterin-binding subunit n=1 Tax=Amycolatopsis sp. cmx-11-12 TaxID=2785795 RepID=UPI0039182C71
MRTTEKGVLRPDGPAKLTGSALYVADKPHQEALVAALVLSTVARGRLAGLDTSVAETAPGVHRVLGYEDLPRLNPLPSPPLGHTVLPMQGPIVHYEGQPIAVVLAGTWHQARYAASLVRVHYDSVERPISFWEAEAIPAAGPSMLRADADVATGDVEAGIARADAVIDEVYTTSDRHANPIEPHGTVAWWEGGQLVVHTTTQGIALTQQTLAGLFGMPPEDVRVDSRYVGGGFGSKAYVWPHIPLAVAAAKACDRPVRLVLTRAEMYTLCGHQPATWQRVRLGSTSEGRLTALEHIGSHATSRAVDYHVENMTQAAVALYASPAIALHARVQQVDRPAPTPMRSPNEAVGMFAVESAMDELAHRLDLDPVELRLRNEPSADPMTGKPFSSRTLEACIREGARRFGWSPRPPIASLREGNDLIGWGMSACAMEVHRGPASARIRADANGRIVVETGLEEIGTGLPAMVQAVAAEVLDLVPEDIRVHHGDSTLPAHVGGFGSMSTMGIGSAVHIAASELREKLEAAGGFEGLRQAGITELTAEGAWAPEPTASATGASRDFSTHVYGAVFVEVRVDAELGFVRLNRCVGVYGAGRIINPLAARSQLTGGIIWGYGHALLERSVLENERGRFLSKNLAGYVVPVNADIGDIDVSFIEDDDRRTSALGAKGIGEIGANGVAPAIANAVFHATGRRVRDLPIQIHDLL